MQIGDLVNGLFEAWGAVAVWRNGFQLLNDKVYKGVRLDSTVFFMAWGYWNIYYYPSLDQWLSFVAGLFLVAGNTWWVWLMVYYRFLYPPGVAR